MRRAKFVVVIALAAVLSCEPESKITSNKRSPKPAEKVAAAEQQTESAAVTVQKRVRFKNHPLYVMARLVKAIHKRDQDEFRRCIYFDEEALRTSLTEALKAKFTENPAWSRIPANKREEIMQVMAQALSTITKSLLLDVEVVASIEGPFLDYLMEDISDADIETAVAEAIQSKAIEIQGNVAYAVAGDGKRKPMFRFRKTSQGEWQVDITALFEDYVDKMLVGP